MPKSTGSADLDNPSHNSEHQSKHTSEAGSTGQSRSVGKKLRFRKVQLALLVAAMVVIGIDAVLLSYASNGIIPSNKTPWTPYSFSKTVRSGRAIGGNQLTQVQLVSQMAQNIKQRNRVRTISTQAAGFPTIGDPSVSLLANAPQINCSVDQYCTNDEYLDAINYARATLENLPPLTINMSDFNSLTPTQQLFTIINIERYSRQLLPFTVLDNTLDSIAQAGAQSEGDPGAPPTSYPGGVTGTGTGGRIFAGGTSSALYSDYLWLYQDGWNGDQTTNEDCTSATSTGCWDHRNIILNNMQGYYTYFAPNTPTLIMGASVLTYLNTQAAVFTASHPAPIASDTSFTWAQAIADLSTTVSSYAGAPTLAAGSRLNPGQTLASPNGSNVLIYQTDGNLVVYNALHQPLWSSNTGGTSAGNVSMQTDGNLVIYNASGQAVWSSQTNGTGSANVLVMQNDGDLVIYTSNTVPLWSSFAGLLVHGTTLSAGQSLTPGESLASSANGYSATYQTDGNFVVYNSSGVPLWQSGTAGTSAGHVAMQTDGNLVIYNAAGQAVWQSQTNGTGSNNHLIMQTDGNLVVYTAGGTPVWDYPSGRL